MSVHIYIYTRVKIHMHIEYIITYTQKNMYMHQKTLEIINYNGTFTDTN